jgi:N-acetylglucosamine kinase-like BadF-type ATPase
MKVVVDGGSTKADWKMIGTEETRSLTTKGFNPVFHSEEQIFNALSEAFSSEDLPISEADQIYYYGAGCWDEGRKGTVRRALQRIFENAEIEVEHDLLGAARATCGREPGISCIVGTGSNSCLYDGIKVVDNIINLGYLLGDEGSGTHLAKRLLRAYFYREMPKVLSDKLDATLPEGKRSILDKVYSLDPPNAYLASFTKFMGEHQDHPFILRILFDSFEQFIDRHVRKYHNHMVLPVHFIGSVAYYFRNIFEVILEEREMRPGIFIRKPIDNLVKFHTEQTNGKTASTT